ncbi:MAG TPA: prephenate dehydrogenase/arogenate dehydrogenase family protein [Blastocatellia bacterium]|nr:prephenate dehydrogenase/arogenate dehydrogenase family protein [Blastocatellia bacterium]
MQFRQLTVVGVGLIGGSFALAARRAGIAERVTGWDSREVLDRAIQLGVIDAADRAFEEGRPSDADLVYVAAPVGAIIEFLRNAGSSLNPGAIVTDAGSTKREICRAALESLPGHVRFVGGHPKAGSHNSGVEHADADLFRNAAYALVVNESSDESQDAVDRIADVVRGIGARPVTLTAEEHDRAVARLSHVPQLMATALAGSVLESDLRLAGPGFSEVMRLAASRWSVWQDICRTNADEIGAALDEVMTAIGQMRSSISSGDFATVGTAFGDANGLMRRFQMASERDLRKESTGD